MRNVFFCDRWNRVDQQSRRNNAHTDDSHGRTLLRSPQQLQPRPCRQCNQQLFDTL